MASQRHAFADLLPQIALAPDRSSALSPLLSRDPPPPYSPSSCPLTLAVAMPAHPRRLAPTPPRPAPASRSAAAPRLRHVVSEQEQEPCAFAFATPSMFSASSRSPSEPRVHDDIHTILGLDRLRPSSILRRLSYRLLL